MRWLIISLLCLAGCGGNPPRAPSASGQSISWDFESGTFPPTGPTTATHFPAVVLLEESPHFHYGRLTAVPSDCGPSYFTTCPVTRAEWFFDQLTPLIGQSFTYQVDLRLPSSAAAGSNIGPHQLIAWQIFGTVAGSQSVWLGVASGGRWYIANQMQPCANPRCAANDPLFGGPTPIQMIDLGAVVYDQWETFKVIVGFNADTAGTVQVSKNGTSMGIMTNQATMLVSGVPQQVFLDVLDVPGNLGIVDFDNLSMSDVQPPP